MIIVLDTNIFYASTLRDPSFTALFDFLARSQKASLHIPQLVLDEFINKWKEALDKIKHDLNRPLQDYSRWTGEKLVSPLAADKAEQALAAYESTFKDTLHRVGAVIRPYPTVSHRKVGPPFRRFTTRDEK